MKTDEIVRLCRAWVTHGEVSCEKIAIMAGISHGTVYRLRAGLNISVDSLSRIERTIPKGWREPAALTNDAA